MSMHKEPYSSPKTPANAVLVHAHHTPCAVVAGISGLKEVANMGAENLQVGGTKATERAGTVIIGPYYHKTEPPTNWFELAAELCHSGYLTETRMRRAVEAVRQAVSR